MRVIFLIIFLLFKLLSFEQSAFDIKYSNDVCNCLNDFKKNDKLTETNFVDCFQKVMYDDSIFFLQECKKIYGDTSEESGYRFGHKLVEQISISLVRDCKTYFVLTDSLRYEDYKNLNKDSLKILLKNLSNNDVSQKNDEFYSNKALLFFELKMYDSSISNVDKALKINQDNFESLYIKAWINELKGNYEEAISLYDKVAELTHLKSFYIFSEIARRKKENN